jgi:hypothetical protein
MMNNKRRYKAEQVLEALFALPSDIEQSEDEFEVDEVNNRKSNTTSSDDIDDIAMCHYV